MKRVAITLTLHCHDDVAEHEFGCDYEPEFCDPEYIGPGVHLAPLCEDDDDYDVVTATVEIR